MIEFDRVSRSFGELDALRNLNLTIEQGEMAFLTGHSGAGKSTLLRLLLLLDRPTGGEIRVNGESTRKIRARSLPRYRRRFGVVFQDHRLLFDRNVHENVALPLVMAGFSPRDTARRVRAALDKVGLLSSEYANPESLSGGEQQMLAIARALARDIKVLLLDEPYEGLAPVIVDEIEKTLMTIKEQGITTVIVEQNAVRALELADRAVILDTGGIVFDGTAQEVLENAELRSEYLAI